jgi:hypothetical protein
MKKNLRQVSEDVGVGDPEVSQDATIGLGGAQVGGPPQELKHIFKFIDHDLRSWNLSYQNLIP